MKIIVHIMCKVFLCVICVIGVVSAVIIAVARTKFWGRKIGQKKGGGKEIQSLGRIYTPANITDQSYC